MSDLIRILLVEDVETDAELVLRALAQGGLDCEGRRVETPEAFIRELAQFRPHVILSDFHMPRFDGVAALAIAHEGHPDIPFIVVSGAIGEEQAIRMLRGGAVNYVMKGNLARLPDAVERALREAQASVARRAAEAKIREAELRFQATFEQAAVGIAHVDGARRYILVNRRLAHMLGYEPAEMIGKTIRQFSHPEDIEAADGLRRDMQAGRTDSYNIEKRYLHKAGRVVWMRLTAAIIRGPDGKSLNSVGVFEDITERKLTDLVRKRDDQILKLEHAVARSLADADDASTGLKSVIRTFCETEGWDLGRYLSLDEAAGVLRMDEFWSKEDSAIARYIAATQGLSFSLGEGLAGAAWQSGEPQWVADADADPRVMLGAEGRAANLRASFMFPVRVAGKTIGLLAFRSREIQQPDARLLQAVRVIGGQIGQFMARQTQQKHVARLNRIYKVLSGINSLIVRVRDRGELFREACRIAVEDGQFSLAWLGIVNRQATELKIVASHDATQGFVHTLPLGLSESAPGGLGMAGRAVLEKKPMIVNSIESDSRLVVRQEPLARGLRSFVVLPLMDASGVSGVLSLYADVPDFFNQEEMKLLLELAGDISFAIDHLEKEERINYLAYYDALTGLANRTLFEERLTQHIDAARSQGRRFAVLVIDIERFKLINESLGRAAGNQLLQQIAQRFLLHPADAARHARLGADQFAVLVPEVQSEEQLAGRIEARHEEYFGPRFMIGDSELKITVRVGAALYPNDGGDADSLLTNAESALKKAKASSEKFVFYTQQMTERVAERLTLENQLRQALEREEFLLHYQPKVSLASGKLTGAEALIRWNDPRTGLVPPGRFIPILEETGLIYEVGRWALRKAISDHLRWHAAGLATVRIAVNVSPLQLRKRDFVAEIGRKVALGAHAAAGLELEITESLIMEDVERNIATLEAIREMGVSIALDDFGTGYSSLSLLARLPVDTLKIDRSFIIDMTAGAKGLALVQTIIGLAHSLGLKVVAEGVETEEQSHLLRLLRCDEMQGYLFSKPVPAEIFEAKFLAAALTG